MKLYSITVPVLKSAGVNKPDRVEIQTPFLPGQEITLEYDLPRRSPVVVGYAAIWEPPVEKRKGQFKVTEIFCNMLVFPHENMIIVESLDPAFDRHYPDRKAMVLFESTVLKRIVKAKE